MEHEERDEIPWSSLIPPAESGVDRRWYGIAVAVGLLVLAFVGMRIVRDSGAPSTEAAEIAPNVTEATTTTTVPAAQLVVAEADLIAAEPDTGAGEELTRAEWFVTDFYTRDGGGDDASIVEAVVPELVEPALALHHAEGGAETFVEWSRVTSYDEEPGGGVSVVVAYRSIVATDDGYDRMPVAFVALDVRRVDGVPLIASLPSDVEPWSRPIP